MEVLLMYLENHQCFDSFKMKESLRSIEEVQEINEGDLIGADLVCHCSEGTVLHLSPDCEILAIRGHESESIKMAISVQKEYGGPIHVTDEDGHFDTIIDGKQHFDDLHKIIMVS